MQAFTILALVSLVALGLALGIVLCLISVAAYLLYTAAKTLAANSAAASLSLADLVRNLTTQLQHLRTEVSAALTKLDAAQLHEASLQIRRDANRLARTVAMLYKLALSQDGASAIAAEELGDRDVNPYTGTAYVDDTLADIESGRATQESVRASLQQTAAERIHAENVAKKTQRPLPDLDQAWRMDEAEYEGMPDL